MIPSSPQRAARAGGSGDFRNTTDMKIEDTKEAAARLIGGDSMTDAVAGLNTTAEAALAHAMRLICFGPDRAARMAQAVEFADGHGFSAVIEGDSIALAIK